MEPGQKSFTVVLRSITPGESWCRCLSTRTRSGGAKLRHHVAGTVNGMGVRGELETLCPSMVLFLGPAWRRDCGIALGDKVKVSLYPEGPQRQSLAPDVAAALDAEPEAGEFFDALAQFYRKAYLNWIDATRRRPDQRQARIDEMIALLKAGRKELP